MRVSTTVTPANVPDNVAGKEQLKEVKEMDFKPDYIMGDCAYDDMEIYEEIIDMESKPIIKMNPRNTVAKTFDANGIKVNINGTPICKANHKMIIDKIGKDYAIWKCSGKMDESHVEGSHCLYNPNHDCRIIICPEDDPRRISIPPRDSDEWMRHYKKRKIGEGLFSYYDELLGLERVNYTSFEDYAIYVMMADITILTLAIIAEKLGIPKFVRDFKTLGFYIMRELFGEIPVDPEILMLVIEILHHFGLTIEMLEEGLKKREGSQ